MDVVTSYDTVIVTMLKNRDQKAMTTIFERYGEELYSFLYQQFKSEELTSRALKETFSLIWDNSSSYDKNPEHFFIWLLQMAKQASEKIQCSQAKTVLLEPVHKVILPPNLKVVNG